MKQKLMQKIADDEFVASGAAATPQRHRRHNLHPIGDEHLEHLVALQRRHLFLAFDAHFNILAIDGIRNARADVADAEASAENPSVTVVDVLHVAPGIDGTGGIEDVLAEDAVGVVSRTELHHAAARGRHANDDDVSVAVDGLHPDGILQSTTRC